MISSLGYLYPSAWVLTQSLLCLPCRCFWLLANCLSPIPARAREKVVYDLGLGWYSGFLHHLLMVTHDVAEIWWKKRRKSKVEINEIVILILPALPKAEWKLMPTFRLFQESKTPLSDLDTSCFLYIIGPLSDLDTSCLTEWKLMPTICLLQAYRTPLSDLDTSRRP